MLTLAAVEKAVPVPLSPSPPHPLDSRPNLVYRHASSSQCLWCGISGICVTSIVQTDLSLALSGLSAAFTLSYSPAARVGASPIRI